MNTTITGNLTLYLQGGCRRYGGYTFEAAQAVIDYEVRRGATFIHAYFEPVFCVDMTPTPPAHHVTHHYIRPPLPPNVSPIQHIIKLEAALAECFRQSGADPDGNEDWRLAEHAVEEVTRLRKAYDEACENDFVPPTR